MTSVSFSFDGQASGFDSRTGLSDARACEIARTLLTVGEMIPGASLLEIGAGTGEIGIWLARQELSYVGLDSSNGMLDKFRARLGPQALADLIHADANRHWPIEDDSIELIFGSRVFHLLDAGHVATR